MRTAIVIPARYASTRLPAKALLKSTGKYLIQHVYEQASQARTARLVIVATDDPRIAAAVEEFGGNTVMTGRGHRSGTDRVAEVAQDLDVDIIVNVQGDEPEVDPSAIDELVGALQRGGTADVATLATPIATRRQWEDPHCVKVVCGGDGRALYFSRAPIPHVRGGPPDFAARPARFLQHLGIYAYWREFLMRLPALREDPLEEIERLEQLRWLASGCRMAVEVVAHAGQGVDTLEQYEAFVQRFRGSARPARRLAA